MNTGLESLGRVRLQGILLLTGVFLIGALSGVALDRARTIRPRLPAGPGGQGIPPGMRERMNLTADQERKIHDILEHGRPRTDAVLDRFLPQLRGVADSIRAEIRAVLTPEQQSIFDQMEPRFGPPLPGGMPGCPPFRGAPPGQPPFPGPPPSGGSRPDGPR